MVRSGCLRETLCANTHDLELYFPHDAIPVRSACSFLERRVVFAVVERDGFCEEVTPRSSITFQENAEMFEMTYALLARGVWF